MTLTTHAVAGAALATLFPNYPVLGFAVGFVSHYFLDAMPHWSYSVKSIREDENNLLNTNIILSRDSYMDLFKIGLDGVLGLLLVFIIFGMSHQQSLLTIFMGAIGGMAPDALQFCYWKWKHEPLITFQRLHNWVHTKIRLDEKPILGILSQAAIIVIFIFVFK